MFNHHHPNIEFYLTYFKRVMNLVTLEVVQSLLPNSYIIDEITPINNSQGVINKIFIVTLQNESKKLLLRVSNTHPFWQSYAKDNHIHCLGILNQYNLPSPELFCEGKYVDSNDSSLFFEYIIFVVNEELVSLSSYKENIQKLSVEERICKYKFLLHQGVEILAKMQTVKVPQLIGSFKKSGDLTGIINDGPRIGPFDSVMAYITELLRWSLKEFEYINNSIRTIEPNNDEQFLFDKYGYIDTLTIEQLQQLEQKIMNSEIKVIEECHEIFFSHNDMNSSNILINPKTIQVVSIIDWDSAFLSPTRIDTQTILESWTDDETFQSLQEFYQELLYKYKIKQGNLELMKIEKILNYAKWACFWVNQWFSAFPEEFLPQLIIGERKNNLLELKQALQEYFNINVS